MQLILTLTFLCEYYVFVLDSNYNKNKKKRNVTDINLDLFLSEYYIFLFGSNYNKTNIAHIIYFTVICTCYVFEGLLFP